MTNGSVEPLKKLHARWGDRVHFVDVLVRQAHPGPNVPAYTNMVQKAADAERYVRDETIPWPVLVDDLQGTTHQAYGSMFDPIYLIDADGRVAYYNMWASASTLHRAIADLLAQDGRGPVREGVERGLHVLPALTDGWRGIRRGLPQSALEMELAVPTSSLLMALAHRLRPLLAPITLRAEPLSLPLKGALTLAAALPFAALGIWRASTRRSATDLLRR